MANGALSCQCYLDYCGLNSLLRSTATLVSGATVARGIGLATIPILSRLYSPSDLGVFALYSSTVLVLAPLATLRYHIAIPLPRSERSAAALLILCGAIALGYTFFLAAAMLIAGEAIFRSFSLDSLIPYLLLIPFGVLAASLFETMTMWATRQRAFKMIASTQVVQSFVGEVLKVGLGLAGIGSAGLIVGHLFGHSSGVANYSLHSAWRIHTAVRGMPLRLIKIVAVRFRGFPLTRTPGQILLALATQAPLFLVAANYDVSVTGQMSIAMLAFMAPFALIGQAAGRAYFAEISVIGTARPNLIKRELRKVTWMLALFAAPIAVILFFFSEPAASFLLGQRWAQAGRFVSMLSLALVPQFVSATVIRTLDLLEAHALVICLHATRLLAIIAAFSSAAAFGASPEQAILTFSLVLGGHYIIQNLLIHLALNRQER
ncbi:lipopolysaccharide biosynthesis protein [Qipengyuania sp. 902]|uniref:lipopolysaccharide biosynthesis protein n=1 Tax=Qipengyuania sp. 902 TaxID=3417565 RepID=UPI003EB77580